MIDDLRNGPLGPRPSETYNILEEPTVSGGDDYRRGSLRGIQSYQGGQAGHSLDAALDAEFLEEDSGPDDYWRSGFRTHDDYVFYSSCRFKAEFRVSAN